MYYDDFDVCVNKKYFTEWIFLSNRFRERKKKKKKKKETTETHRWTTGVTAAVAPKQGRISPSAPAANRRQGRILVTVALVGSQAALTTRLGSQGQ